MQELEIEAKVANLNRVTGFVEEILEGVGCPMKVQVQMAVTVEEIFVNVANYAYGEGSGDVRIVAETEDNPRAVSLTFIDRGIPYDPLQKEDPDITLSSEDRQIGGLGIYMVKKAVDEIDYRYEDGRNILHVRKEF